MMSMPSDNSSCTLVIMVVVSYENVWRSTDVHSVIIIAFTISEIQVITGWRDEIIYRCGCNRNRNFETQLNSVAVVI